MKEAGDVFDAGVAVDDIGFIDCALPTPQPNCTAYDPWQCDNGVGIF